MAVDGHTCIYEPLSSWRPESSHRGPQATATSTASLPAIGKTEQGGKEASRQIPRTSHLARAQKPLKWSRLCISGHALLPVPLVRGDGRWPVARQWWKGSEAVADSNATLYSEHSIRLRSSQETQKTPLIKPNRENADLISLLPPGLRQEMCTKACQTETSTADPCLKERPQGTLKWIDPR